MSLECNYMIVHAKARIHELNEEKCVVKGALNVRFMFTDAIFNPSYCVL